MSVAPLDQPTGREAALAITARIRSCAAQLADAIDQLQQPVDEARRGEVHLALAGHRAGTPEAARADADRRQGVTTTTDCPRCGGDGSIRHPNWGANNCPAPTIDCPDCDGTGQIGGRRFTSPYAQAAWDTAGHALEVMTRRGVILR